jgi:hypothetical protein
MAANIEEIRAYFIKQDYVFSQHALQRGSERNITRSEIEEVVASGEVIEDYPMDKYGPSCLIYGTSASGRHLHLQVSYPKRPKIITLYEPNAQEWEQDFRTRKKDES